MSSILDRGFSAKYIIFNHVYRVKVKNLDMISENYIETFGLYTSGNPNLDRGFTNELVERYLTIDKIVELYKRGANIHFFNTKDLEEIYLVITRHIRDAKEYMNSSIGVVRLPIEDLNLLSDFASHIYKSIDTTNLNTTPEVEIGDSYFNIEEHFKYQPKETATKEETTKVYDKDGNPYTVVNTPKVNRRPIETELISPISPVENQTKPPHEEDIEEINQRMYHRRQVWTPR